MNEPVFRDGMLHDGGARGEFEEAARAKDEDLAEGILRAVAEDVPIESLRRDPLIENCNPVVVNEQPVARVSCEARLHEALSLSRDEVQYRVNPVALDGVPPSGEGSVLLLSRSSRFRPGSGVCRSRGSGG